MANGSNNQMTFQDYKLLTPEEKEFFMFDKLCKLDGLDERFASKWVEKWVVRGVGGIFTVIGGIIITIFSGHITLK